MANTPRGTATHNDITANGYVTPTAPNKKVVLSSLVAKGILTTSGAYAAGKGQADLERALGVPDPVTEILTSILKVVYGI